MPQALIAAAAVLALLGAGAAVYIAVRYGRRRAVAAEARFLAFGNDVLRTQGLLGRQLDVVGERLERVLEDRDGRLVGRYVIVNTPKPDDQTLRGWVRAEHEDGALELGQAELLTTGPGGEVQVIAAGDVLIRSYSFVGFLEPPAD